jgi:predicted DCC family thiol-disulfide oxidoreductase YuxK
MTTRCANGWTGGQYSVFRFALGAYLLVHLVCLVPLASEMLSDPGALGKASESALHPFFPNLLLFWDSPAGIVALLLAGVGFSALFALGVRDRLSALALLYLGICLFTTIPPNSNSSVLVIGWILLAHAFVPRRPYGSWDARGRVDPGADWRMPARIRTATWIVLAIGYVVLLSRMALGQSADFGAGMLMLHFLAFDPAWIKGKEQERAATIFYDGSCGLCHRFVRFALSEDREGRCFRFAPLEGNAFAAVRDESARAETLDQIDSIVLSLSDGSLFVRAAAMLEIGKRLGGLWRVIAIAAGVLPLRWLDVGYDGIARIRHSLFAAPSDACPILPPHLRARFDLP